MTKKLALVTGAAQGIGRAAAGRLLSRGYEVVATDRASFELPGATVRTMDVTDASAIADVVSGIGNVGVLVNCAGIVQMGTILDATDDEIALGFDVNFRSMVRTIRAVLPGMMAAGGGAIVNIASIGSSIKSVPNRFIYSASKGAVIGLTKSVSADFAPKGIRCNAVCPGPIDSPSMRDRIAMNPDAEAARREMGARTPLGRLGTTEEVAELVAYLAEAEFTTGQAYVIDGGMTA
jgi:2-keto-3-deoxy-L-fuconate dehydrogenase